MKTFFRKLKLRWFPEYITLSTAFVTYTKADALIKESTTWPEPWEINAKYEDHNLVIGFVHLHRRRRVVE